MCATNPVSPNKYRGKPIYHKVFCKLIQAATSGKTTTYGEIAGIMGLPPTGNHMATETGTILSEICEDEHKQGRPMLSAVAVHKEEEDKGIPGPGFFTLAVTFGKLGPNATDQEKRRFWENERDATYSEWKQ